MNVVLIPNKTQILNKLRSVVGSKGSMLNPVKDADGNWVISLIELESPEFKALWDGVLSAYKSQIQIIPYKRPTFPATLPTS